MLQIQRASAGSGKTYTLAKKFIWFLIAVKEDGKPWRLRSPREMADGLSRILAITFTNKATNEMKQRIVENLAGLTNAINLPDPDLGHLSDTGKFMMKHVAYLRDFCHDLNASPASVGKAAKAALAVLLNDYSDFRVSTIDSFFQTILRTFAYESNLNDSYQVEIDSDYVASASIDATLDDVDRGKSGSSSASGWLKILMDEASGEGTGWNIFQKSSSRKSIYNRLKESIKKIESEDFKEIRSELDRYFSDGDGDARLRDAYLRLKESAETPLRNALGDAQENCRKICRELKSRNIDPSEAQRFFSGHLTKLPALKFDGTPSDKMFKPLTISDKKPLFKNKPSGAGYDEIERLAIRMYDSYSRWLELLDSPQWIHWNAYGPLIPYLALIGETRRRMSDYLEDNNIIQLGETNSMLKRIIGDDDAPFIYERLGSIINHYLIDEFQDTSRMQWDNLKPLVSESDSRGMDNLIIGDAKQSIYRFRNADPSLITTTVPDFFPRHIAAGMSRDENTNRRSDRHVVEFNNFFFHTLVRLLSPLRKTGMDLEDLYSNVAQYPGKDKEKGYVEVRFLSPELTEADKAAGKEKSDVFKEMTLRQVGPLVLSLIQRGYSQKDIAILVDTNDEGKSVISSLIEYNLSLPSETGKIDFISEESLLVASAEAVAIIINVLRQMIGGQVSPDTSDKEGRRKWRDIRGNLSFFALRHPGLSPAEQIAGFLKEESPADAINDMLADMQTVAIPALVEAITENFVPENLRRSQAVFIAAFQDMVLDFSERFASDIASFLTWWDSKGSTRSISSPEGTDAVRIMTVHKSKGLEFRCVLVPFASGSFVPSSKKSEWRWVEPASCFKDCGLPPFIPVETKSSLENTEHGDIYREYHDQVMMDNLNSVYVAFTRAVSELYIFTYATKSKASVGRLLETVLSQPDFTLSEIPDEETVSLMIPPEKMVWREGGSVVAIGRPLTSEEIKKTDEADKEEEKGKVELKKSPDHEECLIADYGVDNTPAILHYVEKDTSDTTTLLPKASDNDPRSDGNLLHAIMEEVATAADLPRAVRSLKMRGMISATQARDWEPMLSKAVESVADRGWFDGEWDVVNERDILVPGEKNRRPDRVMISKDRARAVIVDYKFGAEPDDKSHINQVSDYVRLFREATGIADVEGYVWYVALSKTVKIQ